MLIVLRHELLLESVTPRSCIRQHALVVKHAAAVSLVHAGFVDAGAEVEQPGGGLPRQADGAPQGAAWPARRRAPRP